MKREHAAGLLQSLGWGLRGAWRTRCSIHGEQKVLACGRLCSEVRGQPRADMMAMWLELVQSQSSSWELGAFPDPPSALRIHRFDQFVLINWKAEDLGPRS